MRFATLTSRRVCGRPVVCPTAPAGLQPVTTGLLPALVLPFVPLDSLPRGTQRDKHFWLSVRGDDPPSLSPPLWLPLVTVLTVGCKQVFPRSGKWVLASAATSARTCTWTGEWFSHTSGSHFLPPSPPLVILLANVPRNANDSRAPKSGARVSRAIRRQSNSLLMHLFGLGGKLEQL